jgi:DNA polymerase elongation subunit (family B)
VGVIGLIIENINGRNVVVRHRDEDGKRITTKLSAFPYCFLREEDTKQLDVLIDIVAIEHGFTGLYGEALSKVSVYHPKDIRAIRNNFQHTWEANIPFVNRVLADRINNGESPIKNYEHRKWYLDAEWCPATGRLRVIVVYDSFTGNEYVWAVVPAAQQTQWPVSYTKELGDYEYEIPAKLFLSESAMLKDFVQHMKKQDPDIITGWFVVGADIKQFITRLDANGIDARSLSPMNRLRYSYKDWAQPIVGVNCIDLMVGFSKLWELKNGKLPSYGLGDVAQEVLGEAKVELPDGHDTYHTDFPLYVHYCRQDVRLLPRLDEKVNALDYYTALQHLVQCDIRSTPFITKMFSSLVLADPLFDRRIPTSPQFEKVDYEGADVMEVNAGLYEGVGILDVKAMYHSNASMHNISWDSLDENGVDCGNGTKFSKENKGLLIRQMDYMTNLRNKFKQLMKDDPQNYSRWDCMQFACKSLVASMYGVCGDSKYGMYHPEVAAAITFTSRQTLYKLRKVAEKQGLETIYGHTDSIFVRGQIFCPHDSGYNGKIREINEMMHPIEVEFERYCDRMILMAKNRYAGNVSWENGQWLDEPKLYVKGIELKQSRMPEIMKESMKTVLQVLGGAEESYVSSSLITLIDNVLTDEEPIENLCLKGKLERELHEYKVLSGSSAAAKWANETIGKNYRKGSFFSVALDKSGKYIAFDDPDDLQGVAEIGRRRVAEKFIFDKVSPYYEVLGWDKQPLENALNGVSEVAWI